MDGASQSGILEDRCEAGGSMQRFLGQDVLFYRLRRAALFLEQVLHLISAGGGGGGGGGGTLALLEGGDDKKCVM